MNTVVYASNNYLPLNDTNNGRLIRQFKVNENSFSKFNACCPTAKLLTVGSLFEPVFRLDLLRVENGSNVVLIKTIEVAVPGRIKFKVDEQFILHHHPKVDNPKREITAGLKASEWTRMIVGLQTSKIRQLLLHISWLLHLLAYPSLYAISYIFLSPPSRTKEAGSFRPISEK